jgi:hypothetical protein
MQVVHELGHRVGAWASGGKVARVVAHPFTISCTLLRHNPHPLVVVWAGPIVGALLPAMLVGLAYALRSPGLHLFRFFAGFCLVANGLYIGIGSFDRLMDAGDMMGYGSPQWILILFGVVSVTGGLCFWNGIGENFGLGAAKGKVSRTSAIASFLLFLILAGVEMIIGSR